MKFFILCFLVALTLCPAADGAAEKFSFSPFFRNSGIVTIPTGETPQNAKLTFPAVPRKPGYGVCLYMRPVLQSAKPDGWNNYLAMRLNNGLLAQFTADGFPRLLRRGENMANTFPFRTEWPWWRNNAWLVFFSDGKSPLDARITSHREEGYDFWFDISDLVNYVQTGADDRIEKALPNTLDITNLFTCKLGDSKLGKSPLIIAGLAVGYVPETQLEKDRAAGAQLFPCRPVAPVKEFKLKDARYAVTGGGDLTVTVGDEQYLLQSDFSYVAQPEKKFNTLSGNGATGSPAWRPQIVAGTNKVQVSAADSDYRLERVIEPKGNFISIRDTFTNTSAKDIGIHVRYDMIQPQMIPYSSFKLAGLNDYRRQDEVMANPTLFLNRQKSSLGMVACDDVLRLQLELANLGNALRMETANFGLRPGESYTFERALYPMRSTKYFDFINQVRADQGLNRTIDGPFIFEDGKIPSGVDYSIVVAGPWFKYGWGAHISVPEYRKIMKKRIAEIRAANPRAKILPRMETDLITLDKRKIKNGDKLPKSSRLSGRYGLVLSPEETRILLDDPQAANYKDSMMFTPDGRLMVDNYYPPEPYIDLIVRPAENNYRTREMLQEIDFMLQEIGCDGVYLDQFEPAAPLESSASRCSFNRWDGRSVKLARSGSIAAKFYDYALTGIADRSRILDHVLKQGKTVVGNSRAVCDATNRRGFRFSEMETDALDSFLLKRDKPLAGKRQTLGHLAGSPVILGVRPERFMSKGGPDLRSLALMRGIITALRNGQLYYYYGHLMPLTGEFGGSYGPVNHMFPFTPVELNEGFLIGRERIITAVSRKFTFTATHEPAVLLFDRFGREKPSGFAARRGADGSWSVDVVLDDWNEVAVIDFTRRPKRYLPTALNNPAGNTWHGRPLHAAPEFGDGVWRLDGPANHVSTLKIPVDTSKTYRLRGEFRTVSGTAAKPFYFGLLPTDSTGRLVSAASVNPLAGASMATLNVAAAAGTTLLEVKNAADWKLGPNGLLLAFDAKKDMSDLPNFALSSYIVKITGKDGVRQITLQKPLPKAYPANTVLRLHQDSSTYIYTGCAGGKLTDKWTEFSGMISGESVGLSPMRFRIGTTGVCAVFFCHDPELRMLLRNIRLEVVE